MEISAIPLPLSKKGRLMIGLLILGLIAIWVLSFYANLTMPENAPRHFDLSGEPTSYGNNEDSFILPISFSLAPLIFLLIVKYRFLLINKYPYLISLPACFMNINKLQPERRSLWINRYFEAILILGVFITYYELLFEWGIYKGMELGVLFSWLIPIALLVPIIIILPFLYYIHELSKKINAEIEET